MVNLVREDGIKAIMHRDRIRARYLCRALEREFGLEPLESAGRPTERRHVCRLVDAGGGRSGDDQGAQGGTRGAAIERTVRKDLKQVSDRLAAAQKSEAAREVAVLDPEAAEAGRDAAQHQAAARDAEAGSDAAWDSPERREATARELSAKVDDPQAVDARMRSDVSQGSPRH